MKKLLIIRHAKAIWPKEGQSDFDRTLHERGRHDAVLIGKRLAELSIMADRIITSSAIRAVTTSSLLAEETGYPPNKVITDDALYLAELGGLLDVLLQTNDSVQTLFLVGHNPGLLILARFFTGQALQHLPECGVYCLQFNVASWTDLREGVGKLLFFEYPQLHFPDEE